MAGAFSRSFKNRVFDAHQQMESRLRKQVSKSEVARRVTEILREWGDLPEGKDLKQNVVTKWYDGVVPETLEKIAALAQVYGVNPRSLAFGPERRPRTTREDLEELTELADTIEDERAGNDFQAKQE